MNGCANALRRDGVEVGDPSEDETEVTEEQQSGGLDHEQESDLLRSELSTAQRTAAMRVAIDPGFVHHRKIQTVVGERGTAVINEQVGAIPAGLPDHLRQLQVDHIYTRTMVAVCDVNGVPTLGELLSRQAGRLFCSTEMVCPTPDIWESARARTRILTPGFDDIEVDLEYTTERVVSDTVKTQLANGSELSVIAELLRREDGRFLFHPLVIGGPWLTPAEDAPSPFAGPEWWSHSYGEVFVEDIAELAKVAEVPRPDDIGVMERVSENAFKHCLAEILGVPPARDWGGEQSDLFSSSVHLGDRRITAAFLLKGPARFAPMGLNHLGKNNDQIYRLAQEPAQLLVVQHCHEILPPVRATLRAFTVAPGSLSRRYCLIDGKDSLRILRAYGKLDEALARST